MSRTASTSRLALPPAGPASRFPEWAATLRILATPAARSWLPARLVACHVWLRDADSSVAPRIECRGAATAIVGIVAEIWNDLRRLYVQDRERADDSVTH